MLDGTMGETVGKKILCFIESLEAGGAQRQLVFLVGLLRERGYCPVVVTYYPDDFYAGRLDALGIEHVLLPVAGSKWRRWNAFRRVLKAHRPAAVVSFSESASMLLCTLRPLQHFRLIVSERNTTQAMGTTDRIRFQLYRLADRVVCNSHSQTLFMQAHTPYLMAKTSTITNYLDTNQFKPSIGSVRTTASRRLVVLARVAPQKNALRFIEALRRVRDDGFALSVDWYGHPLADYLSECERLIADHALGDVLRFYPPHAHAEQLYVNYDGCCLPSIYEGYPNVVAEAMSCGLPVLCGEVCDNRYLVGKEGNFVFDPYDVGDMVAKLEEFCRQGDAELSALGHRNRERALRLFSSDEFVNKYIHLIES